MSKIKICGITNKEDALHCVSLGAHAIGFIFYKNSPRYVSPEKVQEITYFLPPFVQLTGVFVNSSAQFINQTMKNCKLDIIQLHGDEPTSLISSLDYKVIKAIRVSSIKDLDLISPFQGIVSAILLDTKTSNQYGGSGKSFDWGVAHKASEMDFPLILSGGIGHHNIKKALQLVNPYAVDVCSKVESDFGKKDYNKLASLFSAIN